MSVYPVMIWRVSSITYLKGSAGLFLLIFLAACGASAPSQSTSAITGESLPPQPPQATVAIDEAPVAAIIPSPNHSPTETLSAIRNLDVHSSDVETATEPEVSTPALATPVATAEFSTPTLAATHLAIPTPADVADPSAVVDKPVPTPTPPSATPVPQDTEAKLGENRPLSEVTPIPTAVPTPIKKPAVPTDIPTPVTVKETIGSKVTSTADGGAHRFVLPSALGKQVSLDEYLERGNVILVFYRAFW